MTERKLLALWLTVLLGMAAITGTATYGLLSDSEAGNVRFTGNVAGNTPVGAAQEAAGNSSPVGTTDGASAENTQSDSGGTDGTENTQSADDGDGGAETTQSDDGGTGGAGNMESEDGGTDGAGNTSSPGDSANIVDPGGVVLHAETRPG